MAAKKDTTQKETDAERVEREKREAGMALGEIYPNPTKDQADQGTDKNAQKGYHGSEDADVSPEEQAVNALREKRPEA